MSEPKPLASLSPSLLARKGAARPAMRPQLGAVQPDALARQIEDLGWNDMGEDHDELAPEELVVPAPQVVPFVAEMPVPEEAELPEVVRQQAEVAEIVRRKPAAKVSPAPVSIPAAGNAAGPRRSALASGRRAAFTLRVDADRHLKLRLACAIRNRSAQQLVTEALDRLLDELPDVSDLAAQVARTGH
jgi:hypothetical protein